MSANIVNQVAYLRTSRLFPEELGQLVVECNRSYLDIANAVNNRVIGIFPTNRAAVTGESWFLNNQRQQSFRQVYYFTATGNITHGIDTTKIFIFSGVWGMGYDGTNWYPLPYVNATAANNQIELRVTPTQIQMIAGAGAPPTLTKGFIVLEWISNV